MPYILALILIDLVVLLTNYTPGTWLIGWDNVMPELNINLNFKRALFALWQDYRGLGLVDGMAHTANLMHTAYIAILSIVLPQNLLRYVFIMLTHLMGGIGMYWLIGKLTKQRIPAFLGALFYMFNLGVIQMYFAPLEVFTMHFTALPLVILTLLRALEKPRYGRLGLFFLTSFLMTPQSFVPTVFIAFCILFGFIMLQDFISARDIKKTSIIILLFFAANAFWLLPYVYSVKYSASEIPKTKINQYSSEEIFYRNKEYGNIGEVLLLKGFMLNTPEIDTQTNEYIPLMGKWDTHSKKPLYIGIFTILLLIGFGGVLTGFRDKKKILIPFGASWLVALFFLANDTAVLESMNIWVRSVFPLIGEAFRFPFTKFITLFSFCLSIFIAYGIYGILSLVSFKKIWNYTALVFGFMMIAYIAYPVFGGQFFSPLLRLRIPNEYFETISYFKNIDHDKRIAILPAESFWNWEYRSWGHRGSGFLWYGIPQPILIRPFDPWSTRNEQFYNELHYAFQQRNSDLLDDVLRKYAIEYLVLDSTVINPGKPKAIDYVKIREFLEESLIVERAESFDTIDIYTVAIPPRTSDISILQNPKHIHPMAKYSYEDLAFRNHGAYVNDTDSPEIIYPFLSLFTEKTQADVEIDIKIQGDYIYIKPKKQVFMNGKQDQKYYLELPNTSVDSLVPVRVQLLDDRIVFTSMYPQITVGSEEYDFPEQRIEVPLGIIQSPTQIEFTESGQIAQFRDAAFLLKDYPNTIKVIRGSESELLTVDVSSFYTEAMRVPVTMDANDTIQIKLAKVSSAGSIEQPIAKRELTINDNKYIATDDSIIYVTSDETNTEAVLWNPNMLHSSGYLMTVKSSWNFGLPLTFYVDNPFSKRAELDTQLSKGTDFVNTLILPPIDPYHRGYGIHFVAKTMGGTTSETVLHDLNAYPIPYNYLTNIRLNTSLDSTELTTTSSPIEAERTLPYLYTINTTNTNDEYIFLDQQFQEGWIAVYGCKMWVVGCEFLEHVKINNWANGWKLPETTELTTDNSQPITYNLLFWPQYLQFFGFGFFIIAGLVFLSKMQYKSIVQHLILESQKTRQNMSNIHKKALSLLKEEV